MITTIPTFRPSFLERNPRQILGLIALVCIGMLAFGLYLQHVVGLEPCPMCIVQRYALIAVAHGGGHRGVFARTQGALDGCGRDGAVFGASVRVWLRARAGCSGTRLKS